MSRGRYPRRIKLRALEKELVERYLLIWRNEDLYYQPDHFPRISSLNLFANDQPLEIDVGCGTGEFLITSAYRNPETNYVGVDIAKKPLLKGVESLHSFDLRNIKFIHADFKRLLPMLATDSIRRFYLFFPIPHRKAKHRKRVIFDQSFLDHAYRSLIAGGRISVMTDNPAMFAGMSVLVESDTRFEWVHNAALRGESLTHNQNIWESRGRTTLRFEAEKATSKE